MAYSFLDQYSSPLNIQDQIIDPQEAYMSFGSPPMSPNLIPEKYRPIQKEEMEQRPGIGSDIVQGGVKGFFKKGLKSLGPKEKVLEGAGTAQKLSWAEKGAKLKSFAKTGPKSLAGKAGGAITGGMLAYEGIKKGNVEKGALGGAIAGFSVGGPIGGAIGAVVGGLGGAINRPKTNLKKRMAGRITPLLHGDFNKDNLRELQTMVGAQATRLKEEGIAKNQPMTEALYGVQAELEHYTAGKGNAGAVRDAANKAIALHLQANDGKRDKLDSNLEMLGQAFDGRSQAHESAVFERYPWLKNYV